MTRANAAIWYAQDGFDPVKKGINGRRVAGDSFLRGFLRHADVDEVVLALHGGEAAAQPVRALAQELRPQLALRAVGLLHPQKIAPVSTLFFPSPNFSAEAWRRAPYGTQAWSICGITHTTSTAAVMQGFFDLRMAPVQPWDAVICTSRSVLASVTYLMDRADEHIRSHLRATPPPRPMLPVIPLGVHCDDFAPDAAAGALLRQRLGAGPQDVVFSTIARLTPHEKFDPLPIYMAMQAAQAQLHDRKLHVVLCGQFRDEFSRKVFENGARALMPDVGFAVLDGALAAERKAALSGADVFMFLIDNIQETFGIAPLEGMAAGLPLLVSDWDGMKDTVPPEVGFRVTSRTLPGSYLASEALRYQGGTDSYLQYCAATSALTEIDQPELVDRILTLARDGDLRRRMGQAAQAHVRAHYDWSVIVPQMQALWAEQEAMRVAAKPLRYRSDSLPIAPSPTHYFAAYPTEQVTLKDQLFVAVDGGPDLQALLRIRNYTATKRMFAPPRPDWLGLGGGAGQGRLRSCHHRDCLRAYQPTSGAGGDLAVEIQPAAPRLSYSLK